jgi:Flp pilus assembly protein TadG
VGPHFLRQLVRDDRALSSVELAVFAPLLILGLLAMVDVGVSFATRMEMDRNVRAGAQAAMSLNNDSNAIRGIVLASASDPQGMAVRVDMNCTCGATTAACSVACAGGDAPSVFFSIIARRTVDGVILGNRTLESSTRIQIR